MNELFHQYAANEMTYRFLARTNVFVQDLWAFDTDEIESTFFCNGGGQ